MLTGKRAVFIDDFGSHADVLASVLLLAGFVSFHLTTLPFLIRIPRYSIRARHSPPRVFLELGQKGPAAPTIEQVYSVIARRIAESFEADQVSILVRDETSGDFVCAASCSPDEAPQTDAQAYRDKLAPRLTLARDAFVVKRLDRLAGPLVLQTAEIETWTRAFHNAPLKVRRSRAMEQEGLRRIKSHLLVQIKTKDQLAGILSLSLRRARFSYSRAERETLTSIASQLALVLENARLTQRMVAQERLKREISLAAEVQKRLLPAKPPEYVSLQLAGFCEPARGVGGDYYDFVAVDKQRLGIAIADVAGKGLPAALLMSTVQATLRSLTATNLSQSSVPSLNQMVSNLNRLIFNSTSGEHYVTFFYASFDQVTQCLTYVNAGHNPPLHLQANILHDFRQLTAGGPIAGAFEHSNYDQETIQMQSGDLLFLYTDGLTEAMNGVGEEFGENRVRQILAGSVRLSVTEIRDQMERRVKEWCSGVPLYDDLTFVVVKVN